MLKILNIFGFQGVDVFFNKAEKALSELIFVICNIQG